MTVIGALLPVIGLEIAGGSDSKRVAVVVLTSVALMDVLMARFVMLPSMRRQNAERKTAEFTGYAMVESTGMLAVLMGIGTDIPEAALVPGFIGVYGWRAVRGYLEIWPEENA